MRKFSGQRREPFLQWSGRLSEIHKDESFPEFQVYRMQRILGLIKTGDFIHVRRTDQPSVEPVGPRVVRTLNGEQMSVSFFAKAGATVATHVIEAADLFALVPNND